MSKRNSWILNYEKLCYSNKALLRENEKKWLEVFVSRNDTMRYLLLQAMSWSFETPFSGCMSAATSLGRSTPFGTPPGKLVAEDSDPIMLQMMNQIDEV